MPQKIKRNQKPVTLLTGYLGSGKTTVMNELLKNQTSKRIALIVNDMGSVNIDAALLKQGSVQQADSKMIELQNGCICCTLRDEFMTQIESLSKEPEIDAILVEASGISNPASIAESFLMYQDSHPRSPVFLNAIITVVDADRIHTEFLSQMEEADADDRADNDDTEASEEKDADIINLVMDQIEFCNLLILNKCDLLDRSSLDKVIKVIRQIQPDAEIVETVQGKVEPDRIFSEKRFDYEVVNNSSSIQKALAREHKESDGKPEYGIESFVYEEKRPFDYDKFMGFLEQDYPDEIIRAKGYIWFADDDVHVQLFEQAGRNASVSELSNWIAAFEEKEKQEVIENYPEVLEEWDEVYGDRMNQIVFIGKEYDQATMIERLNACLA